ncbi:TPA: threonine--tRNA ligase [Candidatus Falkowbacteria bacterium]|nr:MAG: Threonine-tRNA ligase [Candidatus Falkowbacteria bacterium GW2011_GWF2_43_32]HBA36667.1 threonine--tRNA ligase [Candidatus Falkowbacteria bacterium]
MNKEKMPVETKRHSIAHLLAAAVKEIWPEAQLSIGPAIDNGFYYDIDFGDVKISDANFKEIEKKMAHLAKQNLKFERREEKIDLALQAAQDAGEIYKAELLTDLKAGGETVVSHYTVGKFTDLCRGPHVNNTNQIKPGSFKLHKLAGAYWRGDEKNKMLTRIYGLAFDTKEELDDHLKMLIEAEKRDHRKLGKELDLFCFSELVGAGLPLYTPKGMVIIEELKKHIEAVCRNYGFEKVMTPHLAKIDLYELSGHAKKFSEELFHVSSSKGHDFVMKPVQCPHHTQIYASRPRSYRDLPIRYMESEKQYRAEKTGEVGGLSRVYAITIEDGHTFCRIDQVKEEIKNLVNIIKDFYSALGLWGRHWVSLSVRDYAHPEKYIGETADWDLCEKMLAEISDELKLDAKRQEGEAALYGPKLDFMFRDSLGKEIQIPTVQIDFATPKKFNLTYADKDGTAKNPVMVHRAILGSYERFLALLIEHFAGAFPLWLSPVQVKIVSVAEAHSPACTRLAAELKAADIRVEVDEANETVGNKIRKAVAEKVPYMLVIGDKEANSPTLAVRDRGAADTREITKDKFIAEVLNKIKNHL